MTPSVHCHALPHMQHCFRVLLLLMNAMPLHALAVRLKPGVKSLERAKWSQCSCAHHRQWLRLDSDAEAGPNQAV
jgi:hypothetical protein